VNAGEKSGFRGRMGFVGTGLVPVLTSKRTATRAVPTKTLSFQSNSIRHFLLLLDVIVQEEAGG